MSGKLYIVATPIGNLSDITLRALETLKSVDIILCEDTRVTRNLLEHYQIKKPTLSYHHHSDAKKVKEIQALLADGKNLALVTDAGTPGISDPGNLLVHSLVVHPRLGMVGQPAEQAEAGSPIEITPIPGAAAVTAALSISGFATDRFIFLGFPPHKNKRQKYFKEVAEQEVTTVFYESGHRILKCLEALQEVLAPTREVVICRELTKMFETVYRGTMEEVSKLKMDERGEFVIVINHI
jgi:16S rRNA (cytidine1402-2'-O)-methyltransferase